MRTAILRTSSIVVLGLFTVAGSAAVPATAAAPAVPASAAAAVRGSSLVGAPAATRDEYTSLVVQHSELCLATGTDDDNDGTAAVVQRPCRPADVGTDKFRLADAPDGVANFFQLKSRHSGRCLAAEGKGRPVLERVCGSGLDQQFTFDQVDATPSGPVMRLRARQTELCVGLAEKSNRAEEALVADACVDAPERLFILTTTAAVIDGPLPWRGVASGQCLDHAHNGGQPRVIAWPCHGGPNQTWYREQMGEHTIRLINASSGQCLDHAIGHPPDAAIIPFTCHGGPNQLWSGAPLGDGSLELRNVASGQCLDQLYPAGQPTATVSTFGCHGGRNQAWFGRAGIADEGRLYREQTGSIALMVGGFPMGFWSMEELGAAGYGGHQWVEVPAGWFATLPQQPRDRTLVRGAGDGGVFVIAGGAKIGFGTWDEVRVSGYRPEATINVPNRYLDGVTTTPATGTLVRAGEDGSVYVIAGGAKLAFSTWDEVVQAGHRRHFSINLPKRHLDQLSNTPVDGTLLRSVSSPQVWRINNGKRFAVTPAPEATVTTVGDAALKAIPSAS